MEAGYPDLVGGSWYGLLLPKGTPPAIVDALYKATKQALSGEDVRRAMEARDVIIQGSTPGDQSGIYADVAKLRECLGIAAFRPLEEGLPEFVDWARGKLNKARSVS